MEETLKGHTVRFLAEKRKGTQKSGKGAGKRKMGGAALSLPKIRKNKLVEVKKKKEKKKKKKGDLNQRNFLYLANMPFFLHTDFANFHRVFEPVYLL